MAPGSNGARAWTPQPSATSSRRWQSDEQYRHRIGADTRAAARDGGFYPLPGWGVGLWDRHRVCARSREDGQLARVILTRPRDQIGPLAERLEARGHEVVSCPLIEIEPLSDEPIDTTGYD